MKLTTLTFSFAAVFASLLIPLSVTAEPAPARMEQLPVPGPSGFMSFEDFVKLPKPGSMNFFPGRAADEYKPYVWNRMFSDRLTAIRERIRAFRVDEEKPFVWDMATIQLIGQGNSLNGEGLAEKNGCAKCHGDTGVSEDNDTPSIAGQSRPYAFKQMVEYKHKIRDDRSMYKKMRKLSYRDIADLAAFYEIQTPEPSVILNTPKKPPLLVTEGDHSRYLIPCADCHGRWGEGIGFEAPAIAGQKAEHFIETMTAFKEGDRANDMYGRMRFISQKLTDEEIEELAGYYGSIASLEEEEE